MLVLAFDTCLDACSAAVAVVGSGPPRVLAQRFEPMIRGQAERLVPMIGEVLAEAGHAGGKAGRIVVSNGPGTFTGTRIAVSAARALALAWGAELVAVSSLEMMAADPALEQAAAGKPVAIVVDAHRDQAYCQLFAHAEAGPAGPPELLGLAEAAGRVSAVGAVAAGSGAELVAAAGRAEGLHIATVLPGLQPAAVCIFRRASAESSLAVPLRPLYLRPPDARPQDGKSLARAP